MKVKVRDTPGNVLLKSPASPTGLYNILAAYPDKCSLAYSPAPHADPVLFTGECHGTIVAPEPGRGFGWDTIFVPNKNENDSASGTVPFSLMEMEEKNAVSHRGSAVRQWAEWMGKNMDVLLDRQRNSSGLPTLGHQGLQFRLRPKASTEEKET